MRPGQLDALVPAHAWPSASGTSTGAMEVAKSPHCIEPLAIVVLLNDAWPAVRVVGSGNVSLPLQSPLVPMSAPQTHVLTNTKL